MAALDFSVSDVEDASTADDTDSSLLSPFPLASLPGPPLEGHKKWEDHLATPASFLPATSCSVLPRTAQHKRRLPIRVRHGDTPQSGGYKFWPAHPQSHTSGRVRAAILYSCRATWLCNDPFSLQILSSCGITTGGQMSSTNSTAVCGFASKRNDIEKRVRTEAV